MSDEKREILPTEFRSSSARPPRQIIEDLIENLLRADLTSTDSKKQLGQAIRSLDQCIVARKDECAYTDAVERAPWLTADVEQLKRKWNDLRQSLHALYKQARRGDVTRASLVYQFNEYAERLVECEADEQCFLQAAFPGPSWTDENQGRSAF